MLGASLDEKTEEIIKSLISGPLFPFCEGLHENLPLASYGVYTIWKDTQFIYVGIAGRRLDLIVHHVKMKGLKDRLESHWRGRRSGDQFAVYVFDRFVVPTLTEQQKRQFESGELEGDSLTRSFIQKHFCYRFARTDSYKEAWAIEVHMAKGLTSAGLPRLNPYQRRARQSMKTRAQVT
jgi:hypothetical protein